MPQPQAVKSPFPLFNLCAPLAPPNLTRREQRAVDALRKVGADGILSYQLREIVCCSYIPDVIQGLRKKGFKIDCTLEAAASITVDGVSSQIGRYRLDSTPRP